MFEEVLYLMMPFLCISDIIVTHYRRKPVFIYLYNDCHGRRKGDLYFEI